MQNNRNLSRHVNVRREIGIPPEYMIERYIICNTPECRTHAFWRDSGTIRDYDSSGQAVFRWRDATYNVVRLIIEYHLGYTGVVADNGCGLMQCVNISHWRIRSYKGMSKFGHRLAALCVNDVWRLASHGEVIHRDMTFVATLGENRTSHIIRALYDSKETVFKTACGQCVNPAFIVASYADADCKACLA